MISKEEKSNPRSTRRKRFHNDDTTMGTRQKTTTEREKEVIQDRPERKPSYDDNMCIFYIYRDSTARWIEIRRSHLKEATRHHHTLLHINNNYTMFDNQEREEAHTGDISDDSIATTQERRTHMYDKFLFLEENYREEAAAEVADWTIKQGVEDYSDKSFGTFVWNVIERGEYEDLMEAQRFFDSLTAHGPKLPPQI